MQSIEKTQICGSNMIDVDYVVWDFDGVINKEYERLVRAKNFERDIGESLQVFVQSVFNKEYPSIIRGEKDFLVQLADWAKEVKFSGSIEGVLEYWFRQDEHVDGRILEFLGKVSQSGVKNVIATNNNARRTSYIENEMGFGERVEFIFSSGRMKCAKPDRTFFEYISLTLRAEPSRLILIDDKEKNIERAAAMGWQTHHFVNFDYQLLETRLRFD